MREPTQTWPQFRNIEHQAQRLDEVMQRLGIDVPKAVRLQKGEAFARARRACIECQQERKCGVWLEASIVLEAPPLFCPNAGFFAAARG
jgi:hypothetical protein